MATRQVRMQSGDLIRCRAPVISLYASADAESPCVSEALFGEDARVTASDESGFVQLCMQHDGYQGWVDAVTTHWTPLYAEPTPELPDAELLIVDRRSTLLFEKPDIKSRVRRRLPFGARLHGCRTPAAAADKASGDGIERFASVASPAVGFVWRAHCRASTDPLASDIVACAEALFTGAPYLWGGRTPAGADCSGLTQAIFAACGLSLPRDSGDQERHLVHHRVALDRRARNDLVFWPGHVALLVDPDTVFHATAWTLDARREALEAVVGRAGTPTACCRIAFQPSGDDIKASTASHPTT